jgi:cytochrome b561
MALKSDAWHWGSLAKFFHWAIVLLILVQGVLGLYMVELPKKPSIIPYYNMHKSLGMTVLFLAVLRLALRAFDVHPLEPPTTPHWQALGARAGHALLYVLLFAVPLSGWWFDSVTALRPMYFFGLLEIPHLVAPNPDLKSLAHETHEWLFWLLILVACGHAAMALIHQFVNRDGTLARMLPHGWLRMPNHAATAADTSIASTAQENTHVDPSSASSAAADPSTREPGT